MKLLASWVPFRNRCYVVIDVQGNVRVLSFLLDHVLAFPVNLLKTIAATGAIFSLKFTKNRLVAGLRPDPLGELECSPRPPSPHGIDTYENGSDSTYLWSRLAFTV